MWMCVVIFFLSYLLTECLDVPVVFLTSCLSSWVVSCCFAFFPWILLISELENQHPKDMLPKNVQNKCFYSCVEHRLKEWWDMKCEFGLCLQLMFEISFQIIGYWTQSSWSIVPESRKKTLPAIFQIRCFSRTLQIVMSKAGCQQITLITLCSFQIPVWLHSLYKDRQSCSF